MKYRKKLLTRNTIVRNTIVLLAFLSLQPNTLSQEPAKDLGSGWLVFEKGVVFAAESVELSFQEEGAIASLDVRKNQRVSAGQVLCKLDSKLAEIEKNNAANQSQTALLEAQDRGETALAERVVELAKWEADQHEILVSKGTANSSDSAKKKLAIAQAEVNLSLSIFAKSQRDSKARLAQEAVKLSQYKYERLSLRSPIDGTINNIDHQTGEWVRPGTTIVKVARLDEVRVDFLINLDQFLPNQLIGKKLDALSKTGSIESIFSGRITSYDQEVSSSGQVRIHATVQNQKTADKTNQKEKMNTRESDDWLLLPGMNVSMRLQKP